jgi:hypothetical protein
MTDTNPDPVGHSLRNCAAEVAAQVVPPDCRSVVERHTPRRAWKRIYRVMGAGVAVIAAVVAIAVIAP